MIVWIVQNGPVNPHMKDSWSASGWYKTMVSNTGTIATKVHIDRFPGVHLLFPQSVCSPEQSVSLKQDVLQKNTDHLAFAKING